MLILLAYETGDDVHFAVMGTGYIDPMFAVIELDELVGNQFGNGKH